MFPKFAESGTGGIPRRAFNDPRALESLGSSNLSQTFASSGFTKSNPPFGASGFSPPVGVNPNTPPFNNPTVTGKTFVRSFDANKVINKIDRRIRENEATMARARQAGLDPNRTAAALDNNVLRQQIADVRAQRDAIPTSLLGKGEAILVPNWTLPPMTGGTAFTNKEVRPYGTRTPRQVDVDSYGRRGTASAG